MKFHLCWKVTVFSIYALGMSAVTHAAAVPGQGTWETTLQGRDLDGNLATAEAWYDTVLDIAWLANASYAGHSMSWSTANAWATGLDPYGSGITGWRLPDTNPVNGTTYNYSFAYDGSVDWGYNISAPGTIYAGSTGSEMAYMYYNTLGNLGAYDTAGNFTGSELSNTGPFSDLLLSFWSATNCVPCVDGAWNFDFPDGQQTVNLNTDTRAAWAVHSGDVGVATVVPVPATLWLFGSGLLGLLGMSGKRLN